jgi:hypothetical protein
MNTLLQYSTDDDDDDDHVDVVSLRLWPMATNEHIVHTPGDIMSMKNQGGMISTGENSWFIYHNSVAVLPAE